MQETPGDNTPGTGGPDPSAAAPTPPPAAAPTPAPAPAPTPPPVPSGPRKGLIARVRDILMRPAAEWAVIEAEPATIANLFVPYAVVLAAIPPVALLLGLLLAAGGYAGFLFGFFLQMAITFYILSIGLVFVFGLAIDALAPSFGGTKNNVQAMKLAVYSATPLWVGGVLLVLLFGAPIIEWVWLLAGIGYGAYLLYLGLPRLMRVPADKAPGYAAAAIGLAVVLVILARMILLSTARGPFGF